MKQQRDPGNASIQIMIWYEEALQSESCYQYAEDHDHDILYRCKQVVFFFNCDIFSLQQPEVLLLFGSIFVNSSGSEKAMGIKKLNLFFSPFPTVLYHAELEIFLE